MFENPTYHELDVVLNVTLLIMTQKMAPQYLYGNEMCRVGKQRLREAKTQAVDYFILLLAGACLGSLAKVSDQTFGAVGYTYSIIAVCKLERSLTFH